MGAKGVLLVLAVVAACLAVLIHTNIVVERMGDEVSSTRHELSELKKTIRQRESGTDRLSQSLQDQQQLLDTIAAEVDGLGMRLEEMEANLSATLARTRPEPSFEIPAQKPTVSKVVAPFRPEVPAEKTTDVSPTIYAEWQQRYKKGLDFLSSGDFRLATAELTAALSLRPREWVVRQRLTDSLLLSGSYFTAVKNLRETIMQCKGRLPQGTLLEYFASEEEFIKWLNELQKKAALAPRDDNLQLLLAYAYYSAGKEHEAMEILARVRYSEEVSKLMNMAKECLQEKAEDDSK